MTGHGTRNRYLAGGCRCEPCREAHRVYAVHARAKHLAEMQADPGHYRHGTEYGYRCGCRCTRCATAKRRVMVAYWKRRKTS